MGKFLQKASDTTEKHMRNQQDFREADDGRKKKGDGSVLKKKLRQGTPGGKKWGTF